MCPLFCSHKQRPHGQTSGFRSGLHHQWLRGDWEWHQQIRFFFFRCGIKGFWQISPSPFVLRWNQRACLPTLEKNHFLNFHCPCSLSALPLVFIPPPSPFFPVQFKHTDNLAALGGETQLLAPPSWESEFPSLTSVVSQLLLTSRLTSVRTGLVVPL